MSSWTDRRGRMHTMLLCHLTIAMLQHQQLQQLALMHPAFFLQFGNTMISSLVLDWISNGIKMEFVSPFCVGQDQHPCYSIKLKAVEHLLSKAVGQQAVHGMLHRSEPAPMQFANRASCHIHKQFVSEQIEELLKVGSLIEWTDSRPPVVVNGMGVVKNRKGKQRLVLDCRYVNMFVKYEHFTYETLADVTEYLHQGDSFVLTDAKSGYHHIRMHASSLPYFAIEFDGRLLAYPVTPFGWALACRNYTWTMGELHRPFRLHGCCLTYVIDDVLAAAKTRGQCIFIMKTYALLFTALGFFLSWEKCQFTPVQSGKFLGLMVDSRQCKLFVPEDKKQYIKGKIGEMMAADNFSNRQVASVAGMLMSISPAVYMAPLYMRRLYQSMGENMDDDTEYPILAKKDLQFWQDNIEHCDGKTWLKRGSYVHLCGDASKVGYGAYTPNGELEHPMIVSFTPVEMELMHVGKLSSVFREVKNKLSISCCLSRLMPYSLYQSSCAIGLQC